MGDIIESLKIWLFGTIGLFIVMGIIIAVVAILNRVGAAYWGKEDPEA